MPTRTSVCLSSSLGRARWLVLVLPSLATAAAWGQGTVADYERARELRAATANTVFLSGVKPHWFAQNRRFWYRNDLPDDQFAFVLVDAETATRRSAFDHAALAAALAEATKQAVDPRALPLTRLEFTDDAMVVTFTAFDVHWRCDLTNTTLTKRDADPPEPGRSPRSPATARGGRNRGRGRSPDDKWEVLVKDHNLVLRDVASNTESPLTQDGTQDDGYESRIYWSPDSKKMVALRTKAGGDGKVYLIESAPSDQLQPKLHSYDYLKPGDLIPQTRPCLFDIAEQREIAIDNSHFSNPWAIQDVRWQPDSRRFTFTYNQRGHQVLRIVAVAADTGEAAALVDEQSSTFLDYAHKKYSHFIDATHEIVWMSERDGWNHLYLIDSRSGDVKNQITRGHWVVRGVDRVDEQERQIWFHAGGIYPEQDPYHVHYCRINFDGTGLVLLTSGNGTHTVEYSPDRQYVIDTYSRVDSPPVTELRRTNDGQLVCELERADPSRLLATGWQRPERFVAKGRDGVTDIYGVIFRPTTFDATRSYPVIEKIYAGPHGAFVPKRFSAFHATQALAELGFIVVQIDGMGTSHRSKAFHDVCWKNLGDAGFPDRILWLTAAAQRYPCMDLSRVGIFGGSAGGQSATRGLLAHGDFYKVGVSDCGCHDNRMDKIWWNELWMGWPLGDHYTQQSNVTNAHRLTGKLLLIVGELDRNVDPASTMQVVDALIKADRDFEMLVVPGGGHGIAESPYGTRRRRDFFVRHLLGVEPRSQ